MTIDEIKEWRREQIIVEVHAIGFLQIIDSLLEQVEAVGICELCQSEVVARADQYRDKLSIATEALERIAGNEEYDDISYSDLADIASAALERIRG